jgi:hypothetical protein
MMVSPSSTLTYLEEKDKEDNDLVNLDMIRGLSVPNLTITPDITEISQMTTLKAQNCENFSVSNKFGKLEFVGKVDLLSILNTSTHQF